MFVLLSLKLHSGFLIINRFISLLGECWRPTLIPLYCSAAVPISGKYTTRHCKRYCQHDYCAWVEGVEADVAVPKIDPRKCFLGMPRACRYSPPAGAGIELKRIGTSHRAEM